MISHLLSEALRVKSHRLRGLYRPPNIFATVTFRSMKSAEGIVIVEKMKAYTQAFVLDNFHLGDQKEDGKINLIWALRK